MIDVTEAISHGVSALLGRAGGLLGGVMAEKKAVQTMINIIA